MTKLKALFLAPVALLLGGATDCEYFYDVTVPSSDTTAPTIFDAVWWESEYIESAGNTGTFTYHLAPGEQVLAISSGMDSGGVKKLTMSGDRSWTCCNYSGGEPVCSTTQPISAAQTESQAGGPGSTVSSGIWLGTQVKVPPLSQLCQPGWTLQSWRYRWRTTAENFHGGTRTGEYRTIRYP
jgi:hypothetical protein